MSVRQIIPVFIILLLFSLCAEASQKTIHIHYPPDRTAMELGLVSVTFTVQKDAADDIVILVNDEKQVRKKSDGKIISATLSIQPGINSIGIQAFRNGNLTASESMSIFRRSDIISEYRKLPSDFTRGYFHMKERKLCQECHTLKPSDADLIPVNIATFRGKDSDVKSTDKESTCYSCHKNIMSYSYVHGPASVWSCLSCHNPDADPAYSVPKPDAEVCFGCHTEQKKDWGSKKFVHGPVTIGNCSICHSPHASENPFNLFKPAWDLCVNCHATKGTGLHVLGDAFSSKGHPTRGKPDPVRKGKELTCASCHDPHASNYPHLWAFEVESLFDLCQKCHDK
jgi:predicted CXXCH cytochrome family protein